MDTGEHGRQAPHRPGARPSHETEPGPEPCAHPPCCPLYHEAIELIGRRWTGAIVSVLIHRRTMRFCEIADSVPELSDRLLSERMKELEARGVVVRTVQGGRPVRVDYELTDMGQELAPAVRELEAWARRWLAAPDASSHAGTGREKLPKPG
ncbi:MAG: winged helix-turn-helix transcriptional regulator [Solirubrobacteraceae bacterium]